MKASSPVWSGLRAPGSHLCNPARHLSRSLLAGGRAPLKWTSRSATGPSTLRPLRSPSPFATVSDRFEVILDVGNEVGLGLRYAPCLIWQFVLTVAQFLRDGRAACATFVAQLLVIWRAAGVAQGCSPPVAQRCSHGHARLHASLLDGRAALRAALRASRSPFGRSRMAGCPRDPPAWPRPPLPLLPTRSLHSPPTSCGYCARSARASLATVVRAALGRHPCRRPRRARPPSQPPPRTAATPKHWEQLNFLCTDALPLAADILDHKTIIRCVARTSRREFFEVSSSAKAKYCCIPGWCSCQSYSFEVLGSRKLVCKHELAVMIAVAAPTPPSSLVTNELDDEKWATEFDLALARGQL